MYDIVRKWNGDLYRCQHELCIMLESEGCSGEEILALVRKREFLSQLKDSLQKIDTMGVHFTGLITRSLWYEILTSILVKTFARLMPSSAQWEECSLITFQSETSHMKEMVVRRKENTHVFFGDVAFLGLFNSISHADGDDLLKSVASVLVKMCFGSVSEKRFFVPGSRGGDEFVAVSHGLGRKEINSMMRRIEEEVSKKSLLVHGLKLALVIDLGCSDLHEALLAVEKILFAGMNISPGHRRKTIINVALAIAEKRSCFFKQVKRRKFLAELWKFPEQYRLIADAVRKGAGNISDGDVSRLSKLTEFLPEKEFQRHIVSEILDEMREMVRLSCPEKKIPTEIAIASVSLEE